MFGTVFRFEVRYHLTRPVTYLYLAFYFLMAFFFVSTDAISLGGAGGQVMRNAPWVIAQLMLVLVAIGQVIVTGLVGTTVLRDYQYRTHELLFTTPITRAAYLGGRFAGAYAVMAIIHLGIPAGMILGSVMPWVDATRVLPFDLAAYALPYLFLVLPSILLLSALFFAVGALTRNLFAIYTQGIFLLVAYSIAARLMADLQNRSFAAVLEPFALEAFSLLTRYWTVAEKNTLMVPLTGPLLYNRIVWSVVAVVLFGVTYVLFRFRSAPPTLRRSRAPAEAPAAEALRPVPVVHPEFGAGAWWLQFRSTVRLSFWSIVRQIPFLAIVTVGMINLIMSATYADSLYGEKVWPVTYSMLEVIEGAFLLFFIILITIYAGEAVWRERQLQLDQVTDVLPARTSVSLLGKLGGLVLVEVFLMVLLMVTGVLVQTFKGFHHYEPGLYLRYLFGTTLPSLVQITVLAVLIHVLVNQKYVGHVVMIVFWIGRVALSAMGFDHQLIAYADTPPFTYSDMNGFGPFVPNLVISAIYWTGMSILAGVVAYLFWIRGSETRWRARLAAARLRWRGAVRPVAALGAAVTLGAGGTIFYNTNVLNEYHTSKAIRHQRADYERRFKTLEKLPQPRLVDADVRADLEPEHQAFELSGTLTYVNHETRSLDSVIVTLLDTRLDVDTLAWSRPDTLIVSDTVSGTRIYRFQPVLEPGDTVRLRYRARFRQRGFANGGPRTAIVSNGTFINSQEFPVLGYQPSQEVGSDDERRKEKLPPRERMASLDDESARQDTYLGAHAGWIGFRATVSTAPDQIAIAPGYLVREYEENGRRVFRYEMDRPMLAFFSFLSARYQVVRDEWNGIKLEIYYHPGHEYNLDRMMASLKASLEYYSTHFSPYQFHQLRILEFPRYAGFAQAFPNTVPYSESIGFILRTGSGDDDLDMPYYVTAHETGHQWWAHQVIGGNLQGSTFFSEGLANYSALTAMEKKYGRENLQKFLANELDRYLAGRSTESKKERPLLLVENQPYIHYNKGSLALYAFRDYVGEEAMNRALSRFLADKAFQEPPYTTSREFMTYLDAETPDSLKYVLDDLFRTITIWDDQLQEATVSPRSDGRFDVALRIRTLKFRADSSGNQTEIPMTDLVDIGVFGERTPGNRLGTPLYLEKHWIRSKDTTITVVVDREPRKAGIDPYNKLIDRDPKDNVRDVVR
ncbi:MAG: ABC transporter permease/M1 family aminopeptidase [Gemmatimonadales bacterium]